MTEDEAVQNTFGAPGKLHELGLTAAARAIRDGEVCSEAYVGKLLERAQEQVISLPMGLNSEGLPLGLELDAPAGQDRDLLALARRSNSHWVRDAPLASNLHVTHQERGS